LHNSERMSTIMNRSYVNRLPSNLFGGEGEARHRNSAIVSPAALRNIPALIWHPVADSTHFI